MVCEKKFEICTCTLFETVQTVQKILADDIRVKWVHPIDDPICSARAEDVEIYGCRLCIQTSSGKMYSYHCQDAFMLELLIKDAFWGVELDKRLTISTMVGLPVLTIEGVNWRCS